MVKPRLIDLGDQMKSTKHIEVVRSNTRGLSSMSQASCAAIVEVLLKHFTNVGVSVIDDVSDLELLVASKPDLVFLGMEFVPKNLAHGVNDPQSIWLSDYLDESGIAYTGSNQTAHELERNKPLAKQRALQANLNTPAYVVIKQDQLINDAYVKLNYPLFIKPANRGGGLGIDADSIVQTFAQLKFKVNFIINSLASDALIEEYLPGREFSVAILKEPSSDQYKAMPIELIAPLDEHGSRYLSSAVKSENAEQVLEVSDPLLKSAISTLALAIFEALGARDYGRIDIRLDSFGTPYFLEANLIPSLISGYGSFPKACVLNAAIGYEAMIMRIVNLGLARSKSEETILLEQEVLSGAYIPAELAFES